MNELTNDHTNKFIGRQITYLLGQMGTLLIIALSNLPLRLPSFPSAPTAHHTSLPLQCFSSCCKLSSITRAMKWTPLWHEIFSSHWQSDCFKAKEDISVSILFVALRYMHPFSKCLDGKDTELRIWCHSKFLLLCLFRFVVLLLVFFFWASPCFSPSYSCF